MRSNYALSLLILFLASLTVLGQSSTDKPAKTKRVFQFFCHDSTTSLFTMFPIVKLSIYHLSKSLDQRNPASGPYIVSLAHPHTHQGPGGSSSYPHSLPSRESKTRQKQIIPRKSCIRCKGSKRGKRSRLMVVVVVVVVEVMFLPSHGS